MGDMADWITDNNTMPWDGMGEEMSNETVLIDYDKMKHDTGMATLFDIDGDDVWIPNSQIEDVYESENQVEVTRWFAEKENLV